MKKQAMAVAATGATLGALLFVSVDEGKVRLGKDSHELVLAAGQSGTIGADGIPRLTDPQPAASATTAPSPAATPPERSRARRLDPAKNEWPPAPEHAAKP